MVINDMRLPIEENGLPQNEAVALSLFRNLDNTQKEKVMVFMQRHVIIEV